jgi:hypothetical protein
LPAEIPLELPKITLTLTSSTQPAEISPIDIALSNALPFQMEP